MIQYDVLSRTGTVVEVQVWAETEISASVKGGGGYIAQGSGQIGSTKFHLTSTAKPSGRAFVKWADGSESEISLTQGLAARPGHLIYERNIEVDGATYPVLIANLSLGSIGRFEYAPSKGKPAGVHAAILGGGGGAVAAFALQSMLGLPLGALVLLAPLFVAVGAALLFYFSGRGNVAKAEHARAMRERDMLALIDDAGRLPLPIPSN